LATSLPHDYVNFFGKECGWENGGYRYGRCGDYIR
jgi:hypothetical protein